MIKKLLSKLISINYILLKKIVKFKGYTLVKEEKASVFSRFYEYFRFSTDFDENEIRSLVFSKDRAMQLYTFLESYFENIENYGAMIVLYNTSNDAHQKSYDELKLYFINYPVLFIREVDFREQLIEEIEKINENKLILYVDDMIFTHKINYKNLKDIDCNTAVLSLSRGKDLTYSSVLLKEITLPSFVDLDNNALQFSWNEISQFSDWTYPLGVSGYMFSSKEFLAMIKTINFRAPNSLENELQCFLPLFENRKGICYPNAISVCVHANLVQDEVLNPTQESFSAEELLIKWNEGFKIKANEYYNLPIIIAQDQKYKFELRGHVKS